METFVKDLSEKLMKIELSSAKADDLFAVS